MCKNTVVKKAMSAVKKIPQLKNFDPAENEAEKTLLDLLPKELRDLQKNISGKLAYIFTNADATEIITLVESGSEIALARENWVATHDIIIPEGATYLCPTQFRPFQALNIHFRIRQGMINLPAASRLCEKGKKKLQKLTLN